MSHTTKRPIDPRGEPQSIKARLLEFSSGMIQDMSPTRQFDIYVAGMHCARHDPLMQMEAHHYCRQVNQDFLQCVLFDSNEKHANLIGIEYIVSERLFNEMPDEEKLLWHPHNYEILSGTLVAPGLPDAAEEAMLEMLMNSYGKTWHTWHTGRHDQDARDGHPLPMGEAKLMWSFNRDGEPDASLKKSFEERLDVDTSRKRERRQKFVDRAHPQCGVDTLKGQIPGASEEPPPGVRQADNCPGDT